MVSIFQIKLPEDKKEENFFSLLGAFRIRADDAKHEDSDTLIVGVPSDRAVEFLKEALNQGFTHARLL